MNSPRTLLWWLKHAPFPGLALLLTSAVALAVYLERGSAVRVRTRVQPDITLAPERGIERTFPARDSTMIQGRQLPARSRGSVIIVHGLGEPDSLFAHWSHRIRTVTDMNVIDFALRGNGRSRAAESMVRSPYDYSLDVEAVIRELRRRNPSGPLIALATHGGLGILATYEATRLKRRLPAFDGIIALDVTDDRWARIPNNRPLTLFPRRISALDLLAKLGLRAFDGLLVASQNADASGAPATHWTYGSWRAADPSLEALVVNVQPFTTRTLVLSSRPTQTASLSAFTWVTVSPPVDVRSVEVQRAIARWTAEYAADAYEPVPPKATRELDILRRP